MKYAMHQNCLLPFRLEEIEANELCFQEEMQVPREESRNAENKILNQVVRLEESFRKQIELLLAALKEKG